jgi:predicted DNA-binding antitoxin AbrB/MazE fold protein
VPLPELALNYTPFGIRLVPLVMGALLHISDRISAEVGAFGSRAVWGWGFERRFLSPKTDLIIAMVMRTKAIYKDEVLKPLTKLGLREGEVVEIVLKTTPIEKLEGLIKISNRKWVEEIIESPDLEPV